MNMEEFSKEAIRKYETKHSLTIKKENIPIAVDAKPELDDSELLNLDRHREFQHIIGLCQWMIIRGRIDIAYSVSSLSRFSAAPREGHLEMARRILGYLKKFPRKGIVMDPSPPVTDDTTDKLPEQFEEFGHQYHDFKENLDPKFPEETMRELDVTIFCNADHAHNLVTG